MSTEGIDTGIVHGPSATHPHYGHCDTCGAPCDRHGCTHDRDHAAALA